MKTITIKVNDEATEEKVVSILKEHAPEMLVEEFSMLKYLRAINNAVLSTCYFSIAPCNLKRLSALLKIWEWKEKNDGAFGWGNVVRRESMYLVVYDIGAEELTWGFINNTYECLTANTELPYFSTESIARRALKELEAEYKVVFYVK